MNEVGEVAGLILLLVFFRFRLCSSSSSKLVVCLQKGIFIYAFFHARTLKSNS